MMANQGINVLPDELLCSILDFVHQRSESSNDLFNVLMVSRKFHNLVPDILYRSPRLLKPKGTDVAGWHNRRAHQLHRLLSTLVEKPDLAKRIQHLDLTVVSDRPSGREWRDPNDIHEIDSSPYFYWPDYNEHRKILDISYESAEIKRLDHLVKGWHYQVRTGFEPAIAGLILALTPSLRHLAVQSYRISDEVLSHLVDAESQEALKPPWLVADSIHPTDWFGESTYRGHPVPVGLSNLVSIKCNGLISWTIMRLPSLRSIGTGVSAARSAKPLESIRTHTYRTSISKVSHLALDLNCSPLHRVAGPRNSKDRIYLAWFTKYLCQLNILRINFTGHLDMTSGADYSALLGRIYASGLRTLILDTQNILRIRENVSSGIVMPMLSLLQFPGLKRIVAPQEALYQDGDERSCQFPTSVEELEILEPSETLNDCLAKIMDTGQHLEHLESILIWRAQNSDQPQTFHAPSAPVRDWMDENKIIFSQRKLTEEL
ncbi:hypothetical protein FB567DRAFT_217622 [Paraphoma chrysanthemicola]|uniref:F-box domain-containing protein n=1 Tax=Paraphoma chrysanthemicola TaxID=798071 RepID=A0A8K0QU42_9PLEO|nr:hypothetical protein FB567DRAFT_217622 [Paraphoma chrysanthemicola]